MKNLIKDVSSNCPECECDIEATVDYLSKIGAINEYAEHYREIWNFYLQSLEQQKEAKFPKKEARLITQEMYGITFEKFRYIRRKIKG